MSRPYNVGTLRSAEAFARAELRRDATEPSAAGVDAPYYAVFEKRTGNTVALYLG